MSLSLLSIFAAGLLTLVTPCILPMLPVYLALLLGSGLDSASSASGKSRLVFASVLFVAGFSSVFTLMGLGASTLGSALQEHRGVLLLIGGMLIALFGLKYLGLLKVRLLERTVQVGSIKTGSRALDALLFGVVFALGWTPCVGPILGSVLTYTAATTSSALTGALYLLVFSLGVGLPLIVLSLAAGRLVPQLRKLHRHLPRFEKATGALMVVVGLVLAVPNALAFASPTSAPVASAHDAISPPLGEPSEKPRIVEFFTARCPVCQLMEPRFEQLRQDCVGMGVEIIQVDVSDPKNAHLAAQFKIRAVPTVTLFDPTGRQTAQMFGERDLAELRAAAAGLLATSCAGHEGRTEFAKERSACAHRVAEGAAMEGDDGVPVQCAMPVQ